MVLSGATSSRSRLLTRALAAKAAAAASSQASVALSSPVPAGTVDSEVVSDAALVIESVPQLLGPARRACRCRRAGGRSAPWRRPRRSRTGSPGQSTPEVAGGVDQHRLDQAGRGRPFASKRRRGPWARQSSISKATSAGRAGVAIEVPQ